MSKSVQRWNKTTFILFLLERCVLGLCCIHKTKFLQNLFFVFIELWVYVVFYMIFIFIRLFYAEDVINVLVTISMGIFNGVIVGFVFFLRWCYVQNRVPIATDEESPTQLMIRQ
eukprot:UN17159